VRTAGEPSSGPARDQTQASKTPERPGPVLADLLSKGQFCKFKEYAAEEGWALDLLPAQVPAAVLAWVANPTADDFLGQRILADLGKLFPILNVNC